MFPLLALVGGLSLLLATVISGPLSDRLGRRRVFVFISSMILALALLMPLLMPNLTGILLYTGLSAFGFGIFQSVDLALISRVLPRAEDAAKDLGVINIASTLPQTAAPGFAGLIVVGFGYGALYPVAIILVLLASATVWRIRSVR